MSQISFYDGSKRLERLSELGDSLEQLNTIVDWDIFRDVLDKAIPRQNKSQGGRPPFDNLLMFKILVIKRLFNLSLDQTEYQISDRISFMRFLGLGLESKVPDAKTIWLYEDMLSKEKAGSCLFDTFFNAILDKGYVTRSGSIVDASFIEAPKRKNTKEQRETLKKGEIPRQWDDKAHPQKLMQRDLDATWAKKGDHHSYL